MRQQNARRGLLFFGVYLVLYLSFVLVNAFAPSLMERTPIAGLNAAILSGFGLIVAAFVMAMVYGFVCVAEDTDDKQGGKS